MSSHAPAPQHCGNKRCRKRTPFLFNLGTVKFPIMRCFNCKFGKPNGAR